MTDVNSSPIYGDWKAEEGKSDVKLYTKQCPAGTFISDYNVRYYRPNEWAGYESIEVKCSDGTNLGRAGHPLSPGEEQNVHGDNGFKAVTARVGPVLPYVTGVQLTHFNGALALPATGFQPSNATGTGAATTTGTGTFGALQPTFTCPAGQKFTAVTGIETGGTLAVAQFHCGVGGSGAADSSPVYGVAATTAFTKECPAGYHINEYAVRSNFTAGYEQLGVRCINAEGKTSDLGTAGKTSSTAPHTIIGSAQGFKGVQARASTTGLESVILRRTNGEWTQPTGGTARGTAAAIFACPAGKVLTKITGSTNAAADKISSIQFHCTSAGGGTGTSIGTGTRTGTSTVRTGTGTGTGTSSSNTNTNTIITVAVIGVIVIGGAIAFLIWRRRKAAALAPPPSPESEPMM